jgi:GDP-L-fucose synthase
MRVWITGGSGSLGSQVVSKFLAQFPSAEIQAPSRNELDLHNANNVYTFVQNFQPTHIVHLAAKVYGIQGHATFPLESIIKNTLIDLSIFEAIKDAPPKWFFYASTVAAYGYPYEQIPLNEKSLLNRPPHQSEFGYAQSKRFALYLLELLKQQSDTNYVYGLLTNMFGQEDRFLDGNGHVLISLAEKAKMAKRDGTGLALWGSEKMSRDFLSTKSAAQIITELVDLDLGILNIGSGRETKIQEVAKIIVEVFDLENGYSFNGENVGVVNRFSDTRKLQKHSATASNLDTLGEIREFYSKYT